MALVGLYGLLVGLLGLGSVAWTEPRLLRTATGQLSWWSERVELEAGLLRTELLVAEKYGLATTHLDSLAPSIEDSGTNPAAFSCFALFCKDLFQSIPTSGIVVIGTSVSAQRRSDAHGLLFFFARRYVLGREGTRTYTGGPTGGHSNH